MKQQKYFHNQPTNKKRKTKKAENENETETETETLKNSFKIQKLTNQTG